MKKNLHERGSVGKPLGVYSRGGPLFSSETHEPKTPSMGPQTQDLYVARGGSPTSILSNVHRESHRGPPWGKSSGGRVSGPGRVQPPPPEGPPPGSPGSRSPAGNPYNLSPNPTQHEGGEESRRLGNRPGCHEKATLLASRHRWAEMGGGVNGRGKREGEPLDRGVVDLASSHTA